MTSVELHGGAILRRKALQYFSGAPIERAASPAIRMQQRHPTAIGLLQFEQATVGTEFKFHVELKKINLVAQTVFPLDASDLPFTQLIAPGAFAHGLVSPAPKRRYPTRPAGAVNKRSVRDPFASSSIFDP